MKQHSAMCIVLILFLSLFTPYTLKSRAPLSGTEIVIGGISTLVTGACLYKLYQWWMYEEPLEELIYKTKTLIQSTKNEHNFFISLFTPYTQSALIDEQTLAYCAQQLYPHKRYWSPETLCNTIRQQEQKIQKRYHKLLKQPDIKPSTVFDQLDNLQIELAHIALQLEQISKLWHNNATYFELYFVIQDLAHHYAFALENVLPTSNDRWQFEQALHKAVNSTAGSFKFVEYANRLDADLKKLEKKLYTLQYNYPLLGTKADRLLQNLQQLYAAIVSTDSYIRDVQAYKTYQLKQERLRLERERLALARQQAHAQERLTNAYEQKVWNNMWYKPAKKETVVVVAPPAQAPQQQTPVVINNNINNPVCNQTVSPVVTQEPTVKQKPKTTVKSQSTEKKETSKTNQRDLDDPLLWAFSCT